VEVALASEAVGAARRALWRHIGTSLPLGVLWLLWWGLLGLPGLLLACLLLQRVAELRLHHLRELSTWLHLSLELMHESRLIVRGRR